MKSSAQKMKLASVDDLFTTEETRQDAEREKVMEIALSELHPFPDHPFQVREDESMKETVDTNSRLKYLIKNSACCARSQGI